MMGCWRRDRRGAITLMAGLLLPVFVGAAALIVDLGFVVVAKTRLQRAADAGALGAGYLLSNTTVQNLAPAARLAKYQTVALAEANGATENMRLTGTLTTPVAVVVASTFSQVQVTLTSTVGSFFAGAINRSGPVITATATAGKKPTGACIIALNPTASQAMKVDNSGSIIGGTCGVYSNSNASDAIYENSGTISGSTIGTVGQASRSNSGSNSWTPTPTNGGAPVADPYASQSVTAPTTCDVHNGNFSANNNGQPYKFGTAYGMSVFCGNTSIGGNGSSDTFDPGIYYVVNGDLTFNNANVTQATGVTFVMTGSSPGVLNWKNNANGSTTVTAPTTGPTAGIVFWQTCDASHTSTSPPSSPSVSLVDNGSTLLSLSGAVYMPCGELDLLNNAQMNAAPNSSLSVVVSKLYVAGSSAIRAASTTGGSSSSNNVVLIQ